MLLHQVEINKQIDRAHAIGRELGGFFKRLTRVVVPFRLAESQAERHLELWVLRCEAGLPLKDCSGIVKTVKRAISRCQEQCGAL